MVQQQRNKKTLPSLWFKNYYNEDLSISNQISVAKKENQ